METNLPPLKIIPVIMSGGSGTRLWPLSTETRPKQFHDLGADRPMILETALRFSGSHGDFVFLDPVIIGNAAHADIVQSLLAEGGVTPSAIVLVPVGRNSAATAALAALIAREIDPEAYVLLAPADHLVARPDALIAVIRAAMGSVAERIVTFGIKPTGPETGYGYILEGEELRPGVSRLIAFKEKPNRSEAERYLREGGYTWNSGVFFFAPAMLLEEFAIASADIRDGAAEALRGAARSSVFIHLDPTTFTAVRAEAVDRAVMEKTSRAAVVPCDIGWADVGSWAEVWRLSERDGQGNAVEGPATLLDCDNSLIRSDGLQISVIGAEDMVVIASGNSVLIMPRSRAQDVKKVIPSQK